MIDSLTALELIIEASLGRYDGQLLGPCGGSWNAVVKDDVLRIWGECHDDMGNVAERFEYQWGLVDLGGIPMQRRAPGVPMITFMNVPPRH